MGDRDRHACPPTSPVTTHLAGWINRKGVYFPSRAGEPFAELPQAMQWNESPAGQHIELGIAEHNLFLLLGALGPVARAVRARRSCPIGTLYDPFVTRGLDALYHALYSGARFIVAATPSGVSLSWEGGAHQSVITPPHRHRAARHAVLRAGVRASRSSGSCSTRSRAPRPRAGTARAPTSGSRRKPSTSRWRPRPRPTPAASRAARRLPADRRARRAGLGRRTAPCTSSRRRDGARGGRGARRAARARASSPASSW